MQIAAANPTCVSREEVDPAAVEHEKQVLREQALNEGKPEKSWKEWLQAVWKNTTKKYAS